MIAELRTDTELERLIAADWLCEFGTEADWNRLLDRHHSDQQLRRRFGEWLLEKGEAKGEGYLALAALGLDCADLENWENWYPLESPYWTHTEAVQWPSEVTRRLPADWFRLLKVEGKEGAVAPNWTIRYATREELEEAAAVAFLLLPESRRAELLAGKL